MLDKGILSDLEKFLVDSIHKKLNKLKIPFEDLCDTPPEFSESYISDPLNYRKYRAFLQLKCTYKEPVALILLYILEKKLGLKVLEIYYHDLIGGTPALFNGVAGRDIDYVVVVDKKVDFDTVKRVEKYLDELVSLAISDYYHKKGESSKITPFNMLIKHNLIEVHMVEPSEKGKFNLNNRSLNMPIEKADIEKLRKIIKELEKEKIQKAMASTV